jgi:hypothetical protein
MEWLDTVDRRHLAQFITRFEFDLELFQSLELSKMWYLVKEMRNDLRNL